MEHSLTDSRWPKIVKAEILLTRRCNLRCKYCAIRANKAEISADEWIEIFNVLTEMLGCPFYPIYGAEPLLHEGIYDILKWFARGGKAHYSLLTNATMLDEVVKERLLDAGLKSITLSIDSLSMYRQGSIGMRNDRALYAIEWAVKHKILDVQGTSTVHRSNIENIPDLVRFLSAKEVWFSFDFIHDSKSYLGFYPGHSKVSSITDLAFSVQDEGKIRLFLQTMCQMKVEGYRIYQPVEWFEFLLEDVLERVVYRNWICDSSPAWITIDSDGTVLVCDDYLQTSGIYATDLPKYWDQFCRFKEYVTKECRGCIWSTHWLAEEQLKSRHGVEQITHGRV